MVSRHDPGALSVSKLYFVVMMLLLRTMMMRVVMVMVMRRMALVSRHEAGA